MAGSARYTAILDACVLYPATLRDLLLSLARDGLFHALELADAVERLQLPLVAARLREVAELI